MRKGMTKQQQSNSASRVVYPLAGSLPAICGPLATGSQCGMHLWYGWGRNVGTSGVVLIKRYAC